MYLEDTGIERSLCGMSKEKDQREERKLSNFSWKMVQSEKYFSFRNEDLSWNLRTHIKTVYWEGGTKGISQAFWSVSLVTIAYLVNARSM